VAPGLVCVSSLPSWERALKSGLALPPTIPYFPSFFPNSKAVMPRDSDFLAWGVAQAIGFFKAPHVILP
jgi:hypothetical protein